MNKNEVFELQKKSKSQIRRLQTVKGIIENGEGFEEFNDVMNLITTKMNKAKKSKEECDTYIKNQGLDLDFVKEAIERHKKPSEDVKL